MPGRVNPKHAALLLAALLCGLLSACQPAAASPTATSGAPAASPVPTTGPPTATVFQGPAYDNPVYPEDFPDPHVLYHDGTYYAYATNAYGANIQLIRSTDLVRWERVGDALPALPPWADPAGGLTWAPGGIQIGENFILYYTTRALEAGRQCLSLATSPGPEGPFQDTSTAPFICQVDLGGSIDPYPFQDEDGTYYLLWKNDGNCCGLEVYLWIQQLSDDGLSLVGEPVQLIQRDQAWERPLIENPAMLLVEDTYYLFYSGNWWESHEYAVGYAICESITGPCEKPRQEPVFSYGNGAMGPGGQAFFQDEEGNLWMAYHAWTGIDVGYPGGERSLRIDPVEFVGGEPVIEGPSVDPQPLP